MQRLAQVGAGGFRIQIRPEGLHRLFAVDAMLGRERQQLDDGGGAVSLPGGGRDFDTIDADRKAAEQLQRNFHIMPLSDQARSRPGMSRKCHVEKMSVPAFPPAAAKAGSGNAGGTA